jgi:hypothetical protein
MDYLPLGMDYLPESWCLSAGFRPGTIAADELLVNVASRNIMTREPDPLGSIDQSKALPPPWSRSE